MVKIKLDKKQENGLYGTPMNIISYDIDFQLTDKEFLLTAIINAISIWYKYENIKIFIQSNESVLFEVLTGNYTGLNTVYYNNVFVKDDIFYYFENKKERIIFERQVKMKKLLGI